MKLAILVSLVVGAVYPIEQVHDTCNSISQYMTVRSKAYDQNYSKIPVETLTLCNSGPGPTCCNSEVEDAFFNEVNSSFKRITFNKAGYIRLLNNGRDKIDEYMTEVLTLSSSHNIRTKQLVSEYLQMTDEDILGIDTMKYPVAVLLDVAESHGVTDLLDTTECRGEMMELLRDLGKLQMTGLYLARLLYLAIPEGINVMEEMQYQTLPVHCVSQLVKSHRCNLCLDSTDAKPCRSYCLAVASSCFEHLKEVSDTWEEYATLTAKVLDSTDMFAEVYEAGLVQTIKLIQQNLKNSDVADMCGFDVATNLARHKRSTETSKVREALFDGSFMEGMLGNLDQIHCDRTSTEHDKCWNGTAVGVYTGPKKILQEDSSYGNVGATEALEAELEKLNEFNQEFKKVNNLKIEAIAQDMNQYNTIITEEPDFLSKDASSTVVVSIALFFILLLLH